MVYMSAKRYFIIGGAGFIGSHLAEAILKEGKDADVIIYDNFSSGRLWHLEKVRDCQNLKIIKGDAKDKNKLKTSMKGAGIVYHLASNPDISKAVRQPDIDFWEGTYLTNNVLEAMRINNIKKILYASGSGVYGDTGLKEVDEDYPWKSPISTYGASKLACEALICSYCHMFDMQGASFRFANVVGQRQTHGVAYDFIRKLMHNPHKLEILGDGKQSKPYIYISDAISAMRLLEKSTKGGISYYNVATLDYLKVKDIADIVVKIMKLRKVEYCYSGKSKGWKGDVPVVRLNSQKIRKLGWSNKYSSLEAISKSAELILEDAKLKRL